MDHLPHKAEGIEMEWMGVVLKATASALQVSTFVSLLILDKLLKSVDFV